MWQPIVRCGRCGRVHDTIRVVVFPSIFSLICHGCEAELLVTIARDALVRSGPPSRELIPLHVVGVVQERRPSWHPKL